MLISKQLCVRFLARIPERFHNPYNGLRTKGCDGLDCPAWIGVGRLHRVRAAATRGKSRRPVAGGAGGGAARLPDHFTVRGVIHGSPGSSRWKSGRHFCRCRVSSSSSTPSLCQGSSYHVRVVERRHTSCLQQTRPVFLCLILCLILEAMGPAPRATYSRILSEEEEADSEEEKVSTERGK